MCTVFQDYALFPSMNVRDNVAYGLRVRGVARAERARQADEALAGVRLDGFGHRKPAQLSGGQRQRVALARALVVRPEVLLLDEPLGALDLKLREQMQIELKQIQREVGITFVFVTHDQEEALTMSDRIAVFDNGRVEQVGTPAELYERPATRFVAGFVGTSNLLEGDAAVPLFGDAGTHSVRPEKISRHPGPVGTGPARGAGRDGAPSPRSSTRALRPGSSSTWTPADGWSPSSRTCRARRPTSPSSAASKVRLSWQRSHGISIGSHPPNDTVHHGTRTGDRMRLIHGSAWRCAAVAVGPRAHGHRVRHVVDDGRRRLRRRRRPCGRLRAPGPADARGGR